MKLTSTQVDVLNAAQVKRYRGVLISKDAELIMMYMSEK